MVLHRATRHDSTKSSGGSGNSERKSKRGTSLPRSVLTTSEPTPSSVSLLSKQHVNNSNRKKSNIPVSQHILEGGGHVELAKNNEYFSKDKDKEDHHPNVGKEKEKVKVRSRGRGSLDVKEIKEDRTTPTTFPSLNPETHKKLIV